MSSALKEDDGTIDGQRILESFDLHDKYVHLKGMQCVGLSCMCYVVGCCLCGAPAYFCGAPARKKEKEMFQLHVTETSIVSHREVVSCGCCCWSKIHKTIPLEKVQDVSVSQNCCTTTCIGNDIYMVRRSTWYFN